jgi:hypothetical protein
VSAGSTGRSGATRKVVPFPRRLLAYGAAVIVLTTPGVSYAIGRQAAPSEAIPVAVGDIVKVSGAPLGCIVRFQNGVRALDCRKTGPLAGTYGALVTGRQVMVVRYESRRAGKIVFSAQHRRLRVKTCG